MLSFQEGNLEALTNALDQGDMDVGIMCSPDDMPKRFAATLLYSEEYVLAIGDDHRFNGRATVEMDELHRERYCERVMCEFSTYIERLLRASGVMLEMVQQSSREDWIQALVRANFGVAFMPISLAQAAQLAYVTMTDVPIVRKVSVLTQAERPTSAAQQAVLESLVAYDWGQGRAELV